MAVGANAIVSFPSYLALAREAAYGTYVTATAGLDFISCSLKTKQENKVIEEVSRYRVFNETISLGRTIEGDVELFYDPLSVACNLLLQNGLGGHATSPATATGETAGGGAMTHTFQLGDFDTVTASLSANVRKGDSASAKIFEFKGLRVNEMEIAAEMDSPIKMTFGLIGQDSSQTSNDLAATIGNVDQSPLSFVNARLSVEGTFASLTSSSFWHVQMASLKVSNNLKADDDSRRIGSAVLQVLPPGMCNIELSFSMRFDTLTAYQAMLNNTQFAAELEFLGDTLTGSSVRRGLKLQMPRIVITEASDPEIGGPDEILKVDVKCQVLRDSTSAGGYAIKAFVTNLAASI